MGILNRASVRWIHERAVFYLLWRSGQVVQEARVAETDAFMPAVNLLWYVLTATSEYDCAHSIRRTLSS